MNYNNANVYRNSNAKGNGFSVRCVKDCYSKGESVKPDSPLFIELHRAYIDARRNKRNTMNQLRFEKKLEAELLALCNELENRTYELRPGICFINEVPVKREIIAADFRDRVIHHFIYNRIYPVFDKQFIYDSYSCRVGKGTLFGVKRAHGFAQACREGWVLRLDIKGFFMAIDREILFDLTMKGLRKSSKKIADLDEYLLSKVIFNDPMRNVSFRSHPSKWDGLPLDKSLRGSPPNCGLPIGNLTSQVFANVYLNPLDHFVKRELKIRHYGRYVDDMVLMHSDKRVLINAISSIRSFLSEKLKLTLHPKKIQLQPASKGFGFLGAYVYSNGAVTGRRTLSHFRTTLFSPMPDEEKYRKVQSYLGLMRHFK